MKLGGGLLAAGTHAVKERKRLTAGVIRHPYNIAVGQEALNHRCMVAQKQATGPRRSRAHGETNVNSGEAAAAMMAFVLSEVRLRAFCA